MQVRTKVSNVFTVYRTVSFADICRITMILLLVLNAMCYVLMSASILGGPLNSDNLC